jgi:hypothetical protein
VRRENLGGLAERIPENPTAKMKPHDKIKEGSLRGQILFAA